MPEHLKTFRIFLPDRTDTNGCTYINESILVTATSLAVSSGALLVWSDNGFYIRKAFAPGYWKSFEEVPA